MILLLIVALTPGLWWRETQVPQTLTSVEVSAIPIAKQAPSGQSNGTLRLTGLWQLRGPLRKVGGYSALVVEPEKLTLFSDAGLSLVLNRSDEGELSPGPLATVSRDLSVPKWDRDIESATRGANGQIWLGYEASNAIVRYELASPAGLLKEAGRVRPEAMADWPNNSGAESIVRLDDGQFVVIGEDTGGFGDSQAEGLLFDGDPVDGAEAVRFLFEPPSGYAATDMAALSDGRLLILLRGIDMGLPPGFSTRIVMADSADIAEGEALPWRSLSLAQSGLPQENYEGLAVEEHDDGAFTLWLVSDDNFATYQRSLVARLEWTPPTGEAGPKPDTEKAPTETAAP